ncbi:MAG TPA: DUF4070 domain-containing protein, partial [Thermoanaerobaculia bacterium]|nr:DUF4070 domain-containing protein [Thermoanaerobaculia bacterium]
ARLEREGRLLAESSGNNVEIVLNFKPELDREVLIAGYRRVLSTLYDPALKAYFERCWTLLSRIGQRAGRARPVGKSELLALWRSVRRQLFSRQGPAYAKLLLKTLLLRPRLVPEAVRLAIKGLHFERFTAQTLAAHDYRKAALAAYDRAEEVATQGTVPAMGLPEALRRQVDEALGSLQRFYQRLRPEFRTSILPDRATVEAAVRACLREAGSLQLIERLRAVLGGWFSEAPNLDVLGSEGYAPVEGREVAPPTRGVAVAPLLEQGRDRRTLEIFFEELGLRVMSAADQIAQLGQEGLARLAGEGSPTDCLRGYLSEVGGRIDTLIVPLTSALEETGTRIQVLAAGVKDRTAALPDLVCFQWEASQRRLRVCLIELGASITGDRGLAEEAFERAFALA